MSDYIKREDAIKAYCEHECGIKGMTRENCGATDCGTIFDDIPSADVVEVVRCKDCKWWKPFNDKMGHCGCDMKHKDQYCNYGERADT